MGLFCYQLHGFSQLKEGTKIREQQKPNLFRNSSCYETYYSHNYIGFLRTVGIFSGTFVSLRTVWALEIIPFGSLDALNLLLRILNPFGLAPTKFPIQKLEIYRIWD